MGDLGSAVVASSIVILVLLAVMGVVMTIVNSRKVKAKQQFFAELHTNLAPGKKILFSGGLYGTVSKVGTDVVEVKLKDGTTLDVSRYAIQEIVE